MPAKLLHVTPPRSQRVYRTMATKRVLIKEESEKAKKKRPEVKIEYEVKKIKRTRGPHCSALMLQHRRHAGRRRGTS